MKIRTCIFSVPIQHCKHHIVLIIWCVNIILASRKSCCQKSLVRRMVIRLCSIWDVHYSLLVCKFSIESLLIGFLSWLIVCCVFFCLLRDHLTPPTHFALRRRYPIKKAQYASLGTLPSICWDGYRQKPRLSTHNSSMVQSPVIVKIARPDSNIGQFPLWVFFRISYSQGACWQYTR